MSNLDLLIDLHRKEQRQGPGGINETRLAIDLAGLRDKRDLKIADIGCGTGASTLILAEELDAEITAVDFLPDFLEDLRINASRADVSERVTTLAASMESLPFQDRAFDAIWSEGAIYNMGFEAGIRAWRRFLKPGGNLAVSELIWLTGERPTELEQYWHNEYPEIATASVKIGQLEENGYVPLGYFPLPNACWLENYYRPLQQAFPDFLERNNHTQPARALIEAEEKEIEIYERYSDFFSYGFFIAKRTVI
ncbi:MAG: class I SAM-dependent methyltransferase [Pseudomonadota bacterium]